MKLPFLLQILPVDTTEANKVKDTLSAMTQPIIPTDVEWSKLLAEWGRDALYFGIRVVLCILLFFVGRYIINFLTSVFRKALARRQVEGVAISLLDSIFVALLYITLGIIIATALGIKSVSFAALLASMGLAIGMALSGQLQNLAGGVIILLTKPFQIGDFIQAQGESGAVKTVSLFHTEVATPENKTIFIPNGILSSGVIVNYSHADRRRVEWIIGVEYNEDYDKVHDLLHRLINQDERVIHDPEPFIALHALADSSVNIVVRAWTKSEDFWALYFDFNRTVYTEFNKAGIGFPFPQITLTGGITTSKEA